jgi:hypothetical protein
MGLVLNPGNFSKVPFIMFYFEWVASSDGTFLCCQVFNLFTSQKIAGSPLRCDGKKLEMK